ncbi:hypothetical protein QVH35_01220 [Candidatus Nitrosotenuis chungbukensis]|uniref:hypothetical protein n=1 Tax=Candidatus Nitrosotenuis chungbukensis TaxID=1353246 RepID=UPI00267210C1|nr:hypothetical protein [Candidatus Nitrosotenuis chungbukensis]WKT58161.1 hypothetical protein QVH35_01220 [Candidatus Nitrosotenuis chungbukensis]
MSSERWFDAPTIDAGMISFSANPRPTAIAAPIAIAMLQENADTRIGIIDSPTPSSCKAYCKHQAVQDCLYHRSDEFWAAYVVVQQLVLYPSRHKVDND